MDPDCSEAVTSPFSRGTILEYSVVQMMPLSVLILSMVFSPNLSIHSLLEATYKDTDTQKIETIRRRA